VRELPAALMDPSPLTHPLMLQNRIVLSPVVLGVVFPGDGS
jgi:hypothetical protein